MAVTRHHNHSNFYIKIKHLIGAGFQPILIMVGSTVACMQTGELRVLHLDTKAAGKERPGLSVWQPIAHPPQWHTSFNKATPPNPSQVLPLSNDQAFKYMRLWGPFVFKPPQGLSLAWLKLPQDISEAIGKGVVSLISFSFCPLYRERLLDFVC